MASKIIKEIGINRICKYFLFSLWQWFFDLLPFSPLRIFWMRLGGAKIGKNCVIDKIDFINLDRIGLKGLTIGSECFLGRNCLLDLAGRIILKNQVTISPKASILSHFSVGFSNHPLIKKYPKFISESLINQGTFIGLGAIILPGVKIGKEVMVAAGSVVKSDLPDNSMAAGVPAKIKKR